MKITGITTDDLELLFPTVIFGAEGEGDDDPGDSEDGTDSDDNDDNDDDDGDDDDHKDRNDPNVKGLKSALASERAARAKLEKQLKAKEKAEKAAKDAELSEVQQANQKATEAADRAEKLAAGFLQSKLDAAIEKAARKANFRDTDDAIAGVDRDLLTFEQDDDDPTKVTIDAKTVETAVKALATKKPHYIKSGTDDDDATGGQFGRKSTKKASPAEELRKKYPALRGG